MRVSMPSSCCDVHDVDVMDVSVYASTDAHMDVGGSDAHVDVVCTGVTGGM